MISQVHSEKSGVGVVGHNVPASTGILIAPVEGRQFKVFCVLWAIAALFHMAHSSVFDTQLNLALLTLAAFFAILKPSLASFVVLITLQIFDAAFRMPFTTNHWIFTAFVNLTLFHVLIYRVIQSRDFNVNPGGYFSSFAPLIRLEVIILYFFAVFHKLNAGFFTPATSCATYLLQAQNIDSIMPLTDQLYKVNAYFTLAVELSIPALLCFPRTRNLGVLVGLFFHCILSYSTYNAFYDFSSLMFATYFLFISPAFTDRIFNAYHEGLRSLRRIYGGFTMTKLILSAIAILFCLGLVYSINHRLDSPKTVHLYFFWSLYSVMFAGLFLWYLFSRKSQGKWSVVGTSPHWTLYSVPLLVFLNGTMPYIGLKTENSYAMFSNLKTEGAETNHFIVPATVQIFDYQKEVVEIVSSTDPHLQGLADQRLGLVLFEFRNYVNDRRPERVEYIVNGEGRIFSKNDRGSYAELGANPYVLRKLMKFRPFSLQGPQPCFH